MRALLFAMAMLAACSDGTRVVGRTTVELTDPADGAEVFSRDPLLVRAIGDSNRGVKSVALGVGDRTAKTCSFDVSSTDPATCEVTVAPADFSAQVKDGALRLSAKVVDGADESSEATALVVVSPLVVEFASPAPAKPAKVSGTSTLEIAVRAEVPVQAVTVTYDDGLPLTVFDAEPYSTDVDWEADLNPGPHTLVATVEDSAGRSAEARLDVDVLCAADADCEGAKKCCAGACRAACE